MVSLGPCRFTRGNVDRPLDDIDRSKELTVGDEIGFASDRRFARVPVAMRLAPL